MSEEHQADTPAADNLSDQASRHTLALNPLVGLRGKDLFDSAGILVKAMVNEPRVAIAQWLNDIVGGKSERAPQPGDNRFSDPTWTNSTLHNRLLKAYLAWGAAVENFIEQSSLSAVDKQRASLLMSDFQWDNSLAPRARGCGGQARRENQTAEHAAALPFG
jgi:poly[(R)-3-hydroxyalkanoate] polymerase subunit PhaC